MARSWLTGFALSSLVLGDGLSLLLFPAILWLGKLELSHWSKAQSQKRPLCLFFFLMGGIWALVNANKAENNGPPFQSMACAEHSVVFSELTLHTENKNGALQTLQFCSMRRAVIAFIRRVSPVHEQFLVSVIMGEKTTLDFETEDSFRRLGIFHLLVVSGSHVTLLAGFVNGFSLAMINLLGSLRLLNPDRFLQARQGVVLLTLLLTLLYCCMTGFSAAAQRAFFVFCLHCVVTKIVPFKMEPVRRIFILMSLQSLWFPQDFFTGGNLLSWMAYLMILAFPARSQAGVWRSVVEAFMPQICISLIVLALFGEFSLIGIFANFLVIPLFSNLMTKTYAVLFLSLGFSYWIGALDALLSWFLEGISYLSIFTYKFKLLYIAGLDLPVVLKVILIQLGLGFVSIRFKNDR